MNEFMRSYYHRVVNAEQELMSVLGLVERRFGHMREESQEYADFLNMLDLKRRHLFESYQRAQRG
jgi:hypothetical protein